jgi:hypothetical protein
MGQNSVTIIVPIIRSKVKDLLDYLNVIKSDLDKGIPPEFTKLNIIHYARWAVIDHGKSWINDPTPRVPKLVFVVDFDGQLDSLLHGLCSDSSDMLDKVYGFCEEFSEVDKQTPMGRVSYLKKFIVKDAAVYIGAPGRTVQQISEERNLRNFIRQHLDSRSWEGETPDIIHQNIKKAVFENKEFSTFIHKRVYMPGIKGIVLVLISLILLALLLLIFKKVALIYLCLILLALFLLITIWLLILHFFFEKKDINFTKKRSELDNDFLTELEKYEDWKNQNQFTQLVEMKEGNVRLITIKAMFTLARFLIRFFFVKGKLMGIPTIHFAKWVMFENNSRVLFFSNFDGSWQQYLGDFIDNSGWGLTGIFSNTKVFPKTNFLITGGAYEEEHFLAWSRNSELVTNVWYSAYPDLSIKNVNNNTKIRVQVVKSLSKRQAAKFLKLI